MIDFLVGLNENGFPIWDVSVRLGIAGLLGIAVGFERERVDRGAGVRTHAVVSVASALFMIVSIYGMPYVDGQRQDPGRIAAQVVTGIGFLGAGVIFMRKNVVRGLTTAASVWAVAGIGLAAGGGMLMTAAIAAVYLLLIQAGLRPLKQRMFHSDGSPHRVVLNVEPGMHLPVMEAVQSMNGTGPAFQVVSLDLEPPKTNGLRELRLRLEFGNPSELVSLVRQLESIPGVRDVSWHMNPGTS